MTREKIIATDGTIKNIVQGEIEKYGNEADLNHIDTSQVIYFSWLFGSNKIYFNCNISEWDVSNGTYFNNMFCDATSFNQDLSNWNINPGANTTAMFNLCPIFEWYKSKRLQDPEILKKYYKPCACGNIQYRKDAVLCVCEMPRNDHPHWLLQSGNKDAQALTSDGSTADYYKLPDGATELYHLINGRNMNANIGEIFRTAYRYGRASHSDQLRDANKIRAYIEYEIERLKTSRSI